MASSREIQKAIGAAGWTLDRIRGDHHIYVHATLRGLVVVPHPRKDVSIGVLKDIEKVTGLKLR